MPGEVSGRPSAEATSISSSSLDDADSIRPAAAIERPSAPAPDTDHPAAASAPPDMTRSLNSMLIPLGGLAEADRTLGGSVSITMSRDWAGVPPLSHDGRVGSARFPAASMISQSFSSRAVVPV